MHPNMQPSGMISISLKDDIAHTSILYALEKQEKACNNHLHAATC